MFRIQVDHRGCRVQGRQGDERRDPATLGSGRRLQRPLPSRPAGGERVQVAAQSPHRERNRVQPQEQAVNGPPAKRGVARTGQYIWDGFRDNFGSTFFNFSSDSENFTQNFSQNIQFSPKFRSW